MNKLRHEVAKLFVGRAQAQGMKGKKREDAAIEFAVGAAATVAAIYGQDSPEWQSMSMLAFFVSLNGYKEMERFADDATRQAA